MIKVSVIVPVYNAKLYLDKCIDSLVDQTLRDMEFIFVDDGSTDNGTEIIKKQMKKDKRIILLEKENGGQSTARNMGLKQAHGEYVAFLDSDDYVNNDMYETLYKKAKDEDLDIVICNYYNVYDGKVFEESDNGLNSDKFISNGEYVIQTPGAWNKLFKKSYLDKCNFKFKEGIIYEDLASVPLLVLGNPKTFYLNKCLYNYVQSPMSTMRNDEYKPKYEDIFKAIKYLYDNMIDKGYNKELEYLITYHFLYLASLNFYKYGKYEHIDHIAEDMHGYFPKWYKNEMVLDRFSKKEIFYMKLFYYKKYNLIRIYRRIFNRDGKEQENN